MNSILTVTSFAETQDLTILATVKAELGITDTSEDARLATWIKQASSMIATYCDRVFGLETVSEAFRMDYSSVAKFVLSRSPVVTVTSVTDDDTLIDAADYEIDLAAGLLTRLSGGIPYYVSPHKSTIVYSAGYVLLDGLPYDIERACIKLVNMMRYSAMRDPMTKREEIPDVRTVDIWVGQVGQSGSMPPDVVDLLAPYVKRTI